MAETKPVNMHKRRAMGENVTGLKKGGAVKSSAKPMLKGKGKKC